jgi:hypothetical protein
MSGSAGDSVIFRPAISGLTNPRVMILNSVLLELRDLPEETLHAVDGRFVVSSECANGDDFVLADWDGLEIELSCDGTGGSAL